MDSVASAMHAMFFACDNHLEGNLWATGMNNAWQHFGWKIQVQRLIETCPLKIHVQCAARPFAARVFLEHDGTLFRTRQQETLTHVHLYSLFYRKDSFCRLLAARRNAMHKRGPSSSLFSSILNLFTPLHSFVNIRVVRISPSRHWLTYRC